MSDLVEFLLRVALYTVVGMVFLHFFEVHRRKRHKFDCPRCSLVIRTNDPKFLDQYRARHLSEHDR